MIETVSLQWRVKCRFIHRQELLGELEIASSLFNWSNTFDRSGGQRFLIFGDVRLLITTDLRFLIGNSQILLIKTKYFRSPWVGRGTLHNGIG